MLPANNFSPSPPSFREVQSGFCGGDLWRGRTLGKHLYFGGQGLKHARQVLYYGFLFLKTIVALGQAARMGWLLLCLFFVLIKGQASKAYVFKFYFMCMDILLHICLSTICIPSAYRDQKKASNLLKLGLQMVLSHHVGAGN